MHPCFNSQLQHYQNRTNRKYHTVLQKSIIRAFVANFYHFVFYRPRMHE